MSAELYFLFGVHNHQPVGNFDGVIAEACRQAYHPFLELAKQFPGVTLNVHVSGGLLEWLKERAPATFDLLGELAQAGRIELLTGGFHEPILPSIPDWDKVGQIQHLSEFLRRHFGVHPRGMWLAERVWEPHLPKALREAGVEYVLVDDSHFALAGLDPDRLGGYYLTEEQGETLAVFPISRRLRYQVPFAEPARTLELLAERRGQTRAMTLVDDGEKFGVWPGTSQHVYAGGWLARFFGQLTGAGWLRFGTFSRYLDQFPPTDRIYLPTAAYAEMSEWALPADAGEALASAREQLASLPGGQAAAAWLRGGFWRNFLVKYPEANDCYWKMLRLSGRIRAALARQPDDPRLVAARTQLWRGQGNDAYWHGVFGGIYLPHLRRATKHALITAERLLRETEEPASIRWSHTDLNGDGREEVAISTETLSLVLNPHAGGSLTELVYVPKRIDLADVLTRRPEAYHAQVKAAAAADPGRIQTIHERVAVKEPGLGAFLDYDRFRRACLLDGLFQDTGTPDPLHPWELGLVTLGDARMETTLGEVGEWITVGFLIKHPDSWPLIVQKIVSVRGAAAELRATYRLTWSGEAPLRAGWGVQWNLALTAGEAPGRYLRLPGRPSLGSRGQADHRLSLSLVDEWVGAEVELRWDRPARVGWAPVETVSLSEAGFERIYQGSAILLYWPVQLTPGEEWQEQVSLRVSEVGQSAE